MSAAKANLVGRYEFGYYFEFQNLYMYILNCTCIKKYMHASLEIHNGGSTIGVMFSCSLCLYWSVSS
jgi:hypothetical protein